SPIRGWWDIAESISSVRSGAASSRAEASAESRSGKGRAATTASIHRSTSRQGRRASRAASAGSRLYSARSSVTSLDFMRLGFHASQYHCQTSESSLLGASCNVKSPETKGGNFLPNRGYLRSG